MALGEKCPNGHDRSPQNTGYCRRSRGTVEAYCRPCRRVAEARRRAGIKRTAPLIHTKECGFCGTEFQTEHRYQKCCSPECGMKLRNDRANARRRARRLPVAPLIQYAREHGLPFENSGSADGTVGFFQADEYAIKHLGVHPAFVYGEQWWEAAAA